MSQTDDLALVARVALTGDTRAFDRLVRKYQSPIRRFFLHQTCGDGPLSDDLAQDTFLKAYTGLHTFRSLSSFSTWLYRIAYNVFYDYLRSRMVTEDLDAVVLADGLDAVVQADTRHATQQDDVGRRMDIYRALGQLRQEERTCITLFYLGGLSIARIGRVCGWPEGTVKSHLSRGKKKMADYLRQNGYG